MPIAFVDIAHTCAPMIQTETIMAVVSVESQFDPLAIRINSNAPLPDRPGNKAEAIEIATMLIAEGHPIDLGLGGISTDDVAKLGLSVSDLFDPCLNLKATGTLLERHFSAAVAVGAVGEDAETMMLRAYYGRGDAEVGAMVGYDRRIADERSKLAGTRPTPATPKEERAGDLSALDIQDPASPTFQEPGDEEPAASAVTTPVDPAPPVQPWDVFGQSRQSPVLIFRNDTQP